VFENAQSRRNRPSYNVILAQESITLADTAANFLAPKATYHGDITLTGSSGIQGDGTYRVTSATRLRYGSGVLDKDDGGIAVRFRPQFASTADTELKYIFAWTRTV
jgi:hypothetical protein